MASQRPIPLNPLDVRPARSDDGAALYAAWQRLRAHNAARDRRVVPAPISPAEFQTDLEQLLARSGSVTFIAEEGGVLAGFIAANVEANQADRAPGSHVTVGYLWVEEGKRRKGVGRLLFEAVAGWARERGDIQHFEMAALAADSEAARFWRAIGFSPFIERLWAPLSAPEGDE